MCRSSGAIVATILIVLGWASSALAQDVPVPPRQLVRELDIEFNLARPSAYGATAPEYLPTRAALPESQPRYRSRDFTPAHRTGDDVLTPEGRRVPVYQAQRVLGTDTPNLAAGPPNEAVLFEAVAGSFHGAADWYQVLSLANEFATPYAISYLSAYSGDLGVTDAYCAVARYHLIEFYDTHHCAGAACTPHCGSVIHSGYLGGILVNLGVHNPADPICGGVAGSNQDFFRWFIDAGPDPNVLPVLVSADGIITAVHRMGTVSNGQFLPAAAQSGTSELSLIYSVPTSGALVLAGGIVSQTHFSDGFGGGDDTDRVYTAADGPLLIAGQEAILDSQLRGRPMTDCNVNGIPDEWEILCHQFPDSGASPSCSGGACEFFADLDANGFIWNNAVFRSPLAAIGCELACVPASADADTNGILDSCSHDCNGNGIDDVCDLDCGFQITGVLCSDAYPGACGTATDCNNNAVPDECELAGNDCNTNGILDVCDIAAMTSADCNANGAPDECEIASGAEPDCDTNGVLDRCERPLYFDCNRNGREDYCDLLFGDSIDQDGDGIPDECAEQTCTDLWLSEASGGEPVGGFEDPIFVENSPIRGLDAELDGGAGDTFYNPSMTWVTVGANQGLANDGAVCTGTSPKAIRSLGTAAASGFQNIMISEYFIMDGWLNFPDPTPTQAISFDYRISPSMTTSGFDFHVQLDNGRNGQTFAYIMRLTSANSDWKDNGTEDPSDDATPGQLWVFNSGALDANGVPGIFQDTAVMIDTDCHHVVLLLDNATGTASLRHDGAVVASGLAPLDPLADRIDSLVAGSITHMNPSASGPAPILTIDNVRVCVTGSAVDCSIYQLPNGQPSGDCNENDICDVFELATADVNSNAVLDACEDCNRNGTPDGEDINGGVSVDFWFPVSGTADGLPDECCPSAPQPDLDGDGDVDLADYRYLQRCAGEVAGSAPSFAQDPDWDRMPCGCADFNEDGTVDVLEGQHFTTAITGPN